MSRESGAPPGNRDPRASRAMPVCGGPRDPRGEMGCPGPQGEQGPQGERGIQGERGETGPQGERGETPTVAVGTVQLGDLPQVIANPTETGISLDFVVRSAPTGPQGEVGPQGIQGPQGAQGETGPQGPTGASPHGFGGHRHRRRGPSDHRRPHRDRRFPELRGPHWPHGAPGRDRPPRRNRRTRSPG